MRLTKAALLLTLGSAAAWAQVNAGEQKPEASMPFTMTPAAATFELPWRIAFLPDGRMLITEKVGPVWLVSAKGEKIGVLGGTPPVYWSGQSGMLGVYVSPNFVTDQTIYLTYSEPGDYGGGIALARGKLALTANAATFQRGSFQVLWHQMPKGKGGQEGGAVAFAPDGQSLFLTVGDRQRFTPAQDPNQPVGKILHLTLDGKPAPGNPGAGKPSAQTLNIINPPMDTELAKTAPVVRTFTYPASAPNQTVAETWTMGHRTPYGMAFAPNGQLWELEHGPRGGDKLNLIQPGKDYGWPLAGYAPNYNSVPVPSFDGQPNLTRAVIQWTPVIAPGALTFYKGNMFRAWDGSAFATGMGSKSLTRIVMDGRGGATAMERWDMGFGVRDMEVAPDGAIWISEGSQNNGVPGALYRVTPK